MAEMWTLVIKNNELTAYMIEDLGIEIQASSQEDMHDSFTYDRLAGSDDLRDAVDAGDLVLNDGSGDLSAADGVLYLTLDHRKWLADNHYTKTDLSNETGGVDVHWGNITNAPSFGSPTWTTPVLYRARGLELASPPLTPEVGDIYLDDSDDWLKYNGATWDDIGDAADGQRVIDLSNGEEDITERISGTWTAETQAEDNTAVLVEDDGDGKQAQWIYDTTPAAWIKIGDVDFGQHLDGGANKHDASEIDVEDPLTDYVHISAGDLETALGDIDDELQALWTAIGGISANTLDGAYDEGGAGAGRIITTDSGPVELNRAAATSPEFRIVPQVGLPSTGLADGAMTVEAAIPYIYDGTRAKWLSQSRFFVGFGRRQPSRNQYLHIYGGDIPSNLGGIRMLRNATIVGLAGQLQNSGTCIFQLRINDAILTISSLTLTATAGTHDIGKNDNVAAGDFLQCYISSSSKVRAPFILVEMAWRD